MTGSGTGLLTATVNQYLTPAARAVNLKEDHSDRYDRNITE